MNASKQLLPRTILITSLSFAAFLLFGTPSSKAEDVSHGHFTETGVEDLEEAVPAKLAAPTLKQNQSAAVTRVHKINASSPKQPAAKRNKLLSAQLEASAVADTRKPTANIIQKQ